MIDNEITLLPSLLRMFSIFKINCWYNKVNGDQNKVEHTAIRCSNCRRGYGLSMDNMNNKYKDIVSLFVFNIV